MARRRSSGSGSASDFPVYWYKLDRNDRDWSLHISYLIEAISQRHSGFGRRAHSMLQQLGRPGSSRPGVAAYGRRTAARTAILRFAKKLKDDLDESPSEEFAAALARLGPSTIVVHWDLTSMVENPVRA